MAETSYGVIKHEAPEVPLISLFRVPYKEKDILVSFPSFGPSTYTNNLAAMQKQYFHSQALSRITFRESTTAESIVAAAYDFKKFAKPNIFNSHWLQAGRILRTSKGVIANPPRDAQGNTIVEAKLLKECIDKSTKIKVGKSHIYLGGNDFGFAEYDSFIQGVQDCDTFTEGGLARILEHTEGPAAHLREIASPKNYKRGVDVYAFDPVKESFETVVGLISGRGLDLDWLGVSGVGKGWGDYVGFAFGVLDSREAARKKISKVF